MRHVTRARYLVAALLAIVLIAPSAQADIVPYDAVDPAGQYIMPKLGNPDAELEWVKDETGNQNLQLFQKTEAECPANNPGCDLNQFFTSEKIEVEVVSSKLWELSWDTDLWNVKYILVKDGAESGGGGCESNCLYMLFEVTELQWQDGFGEIYVPADGSREISHFTAFGERANVAEPVTLALLGVGLLGAMVLGRRFQE
jgi:hypothetical protein